jgi:hypothetical protein
MREHDLSITKQAKTLSISRGSVYYLPRPVSATDLEIMRHLDRLHLEFPFAGSRMLRGLLDAEGYKIGRRHVKTLMKRMGIEALYRHPRTTKPEPGHKIYPYLLRGMSRKRVTLPQPAGQVLGRLASHCPQGAVYASPCKYCSGLHQAYRFSAIPRTPLRYQLRPMRSEQWRRSGSSSDWRDLQSDLSDRAGNPVLLMPAPDSNRRMAPSKGACTGPDATRSSCRHGCRLSPSAASAAIGSEWGDGPSGSWAPFPWTALPRPGPLRSDGAAPWIPDERTLSGKGPLGGLQSPKEQGEFQGLCRGA